MKTSHRQKIYDIAVNTFEVTCYMFPLGAEEIPTEQKKELPKDVIRSLVKFSGSAEGEMVITPSHNLLTAMAANMLGVDNPDEQQKSGALYEISNIICGNTAPLFTDGDEICYIHPPQLIKAENPRSQREPEQHEESVQVYLDEGTAEISVYYSVKEEV